MTWKLLLIRHGCRYTMFRRYLTMIWKLLLIRHDYRYGIFRGYVGAYTAIRQLVLCLVANFDSGQSERSG